MSLPVNQIVCSEIRKTLTVFPDDSINLIVTSPPYWGLRDYGSSASTVWDGSSSCEHEWGESLPKGGRTKRIEDGDPKQSKEGIAESFAYASGGNFCVKCGAWRGQLGLEPHPQMYIDHLVQICRELKRVLRRDGSFYLNMGDTYFGKPKSSTEGGLQNENYGDKFSEHGYENRGSIYNDLVNSSNWLQPKQLLLIPSRVAIALQEDGWILRNDICWNKPNHMPSSVRDRLSNSWEHVFHLVKSERYWYDLDAIRISHKEGVTRWGGNIMKPAANPKEQQGLAGALVSEERLWRNPMGKNPSDFWSINTQPFKGAHFAVFPEKLVEPMIKSSCPEWICKKCGKPRTRIIKQGESFWQTHKNDVIQSNKGINKDRNDNYRPSGEEYWRQKQRFPDKFLGWSDCGCNAGWNSGVVLDPFAGSGTTCYVAKKLLRNYVGIDINPEYVKMAENRLNTIPMRLDLIEQ